MGFIDAGLQKAARVVRASYVYWEAAGRDGFFQGLDPRVKLLFLAYFLVVVSIARNPLAELAILGFILIIMLFSRLRMLHICARIAAFALFFGFLIALPSALNVITRGEIIIPLAKLSSSHRLWIYELPRVIGVTREGCFGVAMLTLRVANSVSLALLVMHTTPFFEIMRALKLFRVPDLLIMVIMLSYSYIFTLSKTVEDIYMAMKARIAGGIRGGDMRRVIAGRIFLIFNKSRIRYEATCRAMQSRGFTGELELYRGRFLTAKDVIAGAALCLCGSFFLVMGVLW